MLKLQPYGVNDRLDELLRDINSGLTYVMVEDTLFSCDEFYEEPIQEIDTAYTILSPSCHNNEQRPEKKQKPSRKTSRRVVSLTAHQ